MNQGKSEENSNSQNKPRQPNQATNAESRDKRLTQPCTRTILVSQSQGKVSQGSPVPWDEYWPSLYAHRSDLAEECRWHYVAQACILDDKRGLKTRMNVRTTQLQIDNIPILSQPVSSVACFQSELHVWAHLEVQLSRIDEARTDKNTNCLDHSDVVYGFQDGSSNGIVGILKQPGI